MFKLTRQPTGRKIFYGITPEGSQVFGEWIKFYKRAMYLKCNEFWRRVTCLSDKPFEVSARD